MRDYIIMEQPTTLTQQCYYITTLHYAGVNNKKNIPI